MLSSVIFPLFIFPATVIGLIYRHLAIGYLNTGRDLRRMESNTRSPIFANFGELLEGIVTVRAFSAEERFLDDHNTKVDLTTKVLHYLFTIMCFQVSRADIDVVFVLDDQPLASTILRHPWRNRSLDHHALCLVGICASRNCGRVHHFSNEFYVECILGLSILDGSRTGSEVGSEIFNLIRL